MRKEKGEGGNVVLATSKGKGKLLMLPPFFALSNFPTLLFVFSFFLEGGETEVGTCVYLLFLSPPRAQNWGERGGGQSCRR